MKQAKANVRFSFFPTPEMAGKGGTQKKNRFYLFKYEHPEEEGRNELNEPPPLKTSRYNPDKVSELAEGQNSKICWNKTSPNITMSLIKN